MAWGYGLKTSKVAGRGIIVDHIDNGEYLQIKGADFGRGRRQFSATVFCYDTPATVEIHLDSVNGPLEGTLQITPGKAWKTVSCNLKGTAGVHDIFFVFKGDKGHDLFEWDWWQMK